MALPSLLRHMFGVPNNINCVHSTGCNEICATCIIHCNNHTDTPVIVLICSSAYRGYASPFMYVCMFK
jgi:hypothetical protein